MVNPQATAECARILWFLTRDWKTTDGDASALQSARNALAHTILSLNGAGFLKPGPTDVPANPEADAAWQSCAKAATSEPAPDETNGSFGNYVLFWTSDPKNSGVIGDRAGLGLNWPFATGSHMALVTAPFLDGTSSTPKRLFFFDELDPSAALTDADLSVGLWPKQAPSGAPVPKPNPLALSPGPDTTVSRRKRTYAALLFVLWLAVFVASAFWFWFIAYWAKTAQPFGKTSSFFWNMLKTNDTHFSLLIPFTIVLTSIAALIAAAGLARKGQWFGALIDERYRFSLSQTQQVSWTVLLIGSLAVMGWFNATWGVDIENLFPTMQPELWAALGINLALTPLISDTILSIKDDQATKEEQNPQSTPPASLVTPALLDKKHRPDNASWVDLVSGETEGTQDQIDVSRLQHLIISGILLSGYCLEVVKLVVSLPVGLNTGGTTPPPFAALPEVGKTFIWLLVFSHAGYLVFKARKKEGNQANAPTGK
ncbi:hypothetical protein [Paraburkholderia sp. SIMBA_053]|uniref:hypothetical protein n=1 Tax=Paraburkholderia sp. SIMBA_053 TaxID=3085794 RepID=UPI003978E6C8